MWTFRGFVLTSLCIIGSCFEARAELGPPVPHDKKLIAWAPSVVTTGYLRDHAEKFQQLPYDGLVINVRPDRAKYKLGEVYRGYPYGHFGGWWGGAAYDRSDCTKAIANLKATDFGRLTDNFIVMMSVSHHGDTEATPPGWFDDHWHIVADNAALLASLAKEAGFKGLLIDVEQYEGGAPDAAWRKPFSYTTYKRLCEASKIAAISLEEATTRVRQRGRQFMAAVTAAYPDITIIIIPDTYGGQTLELFPAFFDGMLEKVGTATLIDGLEGGYSRILHKSFARLREYAEETGARATTVPELHKKHLQYGMGVWIDRRPEKGWYTEPEKFHLNYRTPDELEHAIYNAYTVSDKYVWLFVLHPQLWWNPDLWGENKRFQMQFPGSLVCPQCPHERIPQVYLDALAKGKEPHDLDWSTPRVRRLEPVRYQKIVTPQDLQGRRNLLANGSFEQWSSGEDGDIPDGWEHNSTRGESTLSRADDIRRDGRFAVKLTRIKSADGSVGLQAMLPAKEYRGKTLFLGIWTKAAFEMAHLKEPFRPKIIDFDDAAELRKDEMSQFMTYFKAEDGWYFNVGKKTIRESATGDIWLTLWANPPVGRSVYCDGAILVVE